MVKIKNVSQSINFLTFRATRAFFVKHLSTRTEAHALFAFSSTLSLSISFRVFPVFLLFILFCSFSELTAQTTEPLSSGTGTHAAVSQNSATLQPERAPGIHSGLQHWADDFETENPKWIDWGGNCPHQLILRRREKGAAFSGAGYEHLQVSCGNQGNSAYLGYPLYPTEVRSNLKILLAVRANRSGCQLLGRIVLPLTPNPSTGEPMTLLITGGIYSSIDQWQKLELDDIFRQVQSSAALRERELDGKIKINTQGAYLDFLLLNTYSGPGTTDLCVDSLEISGVALSKFAKAVSNTQTPAAVNHSSTDKFSLRTQGSAPALANPAQTRESSALMRPFPPVNSENFEVTSEMGEKIPESSSSEPKNSPENLPLSKPIAVNQDHQPEPPKIWMNRNLLTINKHTLFVRAIRHRGESLKFLASLGFNTIWLEAPPTRQMEAEAQLLKIWFICPPPINLENIDASPEEIVDPKQLAGISLNRVVAWDLGQTPNFNDVQRIRNFRKRNQESSLEDLSLSSDEIQTASDLAHRQTGLIHQIPENLLPQRPTLVIPDKDLKAFSSAYDIFLLERDPLNSTMSMVSYGLWFRDMLNIVPTEQPLFVRIPTQFHPLLRAQWGQIAEKINASDNDYSISRNDPAFVPDTIPLDQLRLLVYNVVMGGAKGLFFESTSRLDASDEETLYRARSLHLVNYEMLVLEQWLSQGERFTTIPSDRPNVAGTLLAARHVRILIPMVLEPDSQYVCGAGAERRIKFLVRGLPDTYQCWRYSLNGLSPLANRRTAGGVEVELDELPLVATIVMNQNSIITSSISERIAKYAPNLATGMKELAEMRLRSYLQLYGTERLKGNDAMWYERAKLYLDGAEKAYRAHEYSDAFILAQRAMRPIAYMEKKKWMEQSVKFPSPNFQPAGVSFRTLQLQEKWLKSVNQMTLGNNLLPNGDFENIQAVLKSGWKNFQKSKMFPGITIRTEILPEAAYASLNGLKFDISIKDKKKAPVMFDSAPVTIQSPGVHVGPNGTVYQVEMRVNIPTRLVNTVDGLKITDTNSGDVLAERIMVTKGWQKVSFQRIVKDQNPIHLLISMNGYGVAFVDDVKIYPLGKF